MSSIDAKWPETTSATSKRHILKGCQNSLEVFKEFWQSFARLFMGSFKQQDVKMDNYIVLGPSIAEASNSRLNDAMPSNSSQTRKRLRSTSHELSIVQAHHQLDYRSALAERSREFGVFFFSFFVFLFLFFLLTHFLRLHTKQKLRRSKKREKDTHTPTHTLIQYKQKNKKLNTHKAMTAIVIPSM